MTSLYLGIAALIPLTAAVRKRLPERLGPKVFGDLGNLLLALELITAWFFFSQLLVIWYSNIPHDSRSLATRINQGPWLAYSRFLIAGVYLGPLPFLVFKGHGLDGHGHSPVGESFTPAPGDLTRPAVQAMTDEELLQRMITGIGHEPTIEHDVSLDRRRLILRQVRAPAAE